MSEEHLEAQQKIWNEWKNVDKPDEWILFYNHAFGTKGDGFDSFKDALIAISNGQGWDGKGPEREEYVVKEAFPIIGIYKCTHPDQPKRVKILAFAYCDDNKKYDDGMIGSNRMKMAFAGMKETAMKTWFPGCKASTSKQWEDEGMITLENMHKWWMQNDRF